MSADILNSILYLEINFFSIMIVSVISVMSRGVSRMVAQRNFAMALNTEIVFFASDTFWVMMERGLIPYSRSGVLLSKDVYFLFTALMCFGWFVYFEYLQDSPFVKSKKNMWISSVFVLMQFVLIVINKFVPLLYYVNENNEYKRGPFFIALYLFSYIYVIFTCSRAFIGIFTKERSKRRSLIMLSVFPVLPAIGGIIQYVAPDIPAVCGVLAISSMVLYLDWLGQMISVDPLTQLNNRKQLAHKYEQMTKIVEDETPVYLMMIDANKFKEINDTYGHIEGDEALVRIADALRNGCHILKHKATIARYGGDEFVVVLRAESEGEVKKLEENIKKELAKLNKEAGAPYELSVSIGYARAGHKERISLKELVDSADEKLYEEKRKR